MLDVVHLDKRFGAIHAVRDVSFRVMNGESVGLLGPNGAGKSTTVSITSGLLRADAGHVLFEGEPIRGDRDPRKRKLGLVPQELALVEELSGHANLSFFGALQGLGGRGLKVAMASALSLVELTDRAHTPVRTYSGGMKRRLNLAVALLHDPDILLLDEPTVGVDPQSRNMIFEGLEALKARGKSLVYTTHYMEEAERLCDRVVIIDQGKVVADGNFDQLAKLTSQSSRHRVTMELAEPEPVGCLEILRANPAVLSVDFIQGRLVVDLRTIESAPGILSSLTARGHTITHFSGGRADLASIFLGLTGRSLRDT